MEEEDWLTSNDPGTMIRFLVRRGLDDRKARLLACACCRLIWDLLPDFRSQWAVEMAERYADGQASEVELARARRDAIRAVGGSQSQAGWAAYWATNKIASGPLWQVFAAASGAMSRQGVGEVTYDQGKAWDASQAEGNRDQARLIREVVGNPFRPAVSQAAWQTWNQGLLPAMARAIYADQSFEQMPILGDALEEAGCDDPLWLDHCRHPARHVRGCWLLDALGAAPVAKPGVDS
jgi:hypothetical protein